MADMIGFGASGSGRSRQPVYGEQVRGRVGYVERAGNATWICDRDGRRLARVLRYKPYQAPQPSASACGGTIITPDMGY